MGRADVSGRARKQVVLSPRPRHLPNSFDCSHCRCTNHFLVHDSFRIRPQHSAFLGSHRADLNLQLDLGVLQIIGMCCHGEHQNTKGKALHCLTHSWHCIWSCEEIIGPCLRLPHAAASAHNQSTRPPSTFLPQNCKAGNFHPDHKTYILIGVG